MAKPAKPDDPFRWFDSSPEVIRLVVMMYVRYPLSLRNVEDLLFERGIDICHETVRLWWNRFGRCCQPKNSRPANAGLVAGADGQVQDAAGPVSLVRFLARGHQTGGHDVRSVPALAEERRGPAVRTRHRQLPRDRPALVEQVSGRCSPARSAGSGSRPCASTPTGDGTWTRCTFGSTARCATSGAPWITRAKCWSPTSPGPVTRPRR